MKKFTLLGILAIIVIALEFIFGSVSGWHDAEADIKSVQEPNTEVLTIKVAATETARQDSLFNHSLNKRVAYQPDTIKVPVVVAAWNKVTSIVLLCSTLFLLWGFYKLIRLLLSISKREVFTRKNVTRIRIFTYSTVAFILINTLIKWGNQQTVLQQIDLTNYKIIGIDYLSEDWTLLMIIILFTEIFAIGAKIKEEQDLTI